MLKFISSQDTIQLVFGQENILIVCLTAIYLQFISNAHMWLNLMLLTVFFKHVLVQKTSATLFSKRQMLVYMCKLLVIFLITGTLFSV